jgi:hypothetical protein
MRMHVRLRDLSVRPGPSSGQHGRSPHEGACILDLVVLQDHPTLAFLHGHSQFRIKSPFQK